MKFYVIANKDRTTVLANVYEAPYQYSEYTQGGGTFGLETTDIKNCFSDGEISLAIFLTKEYAEKELSYREYLQKQGFEVCSILELEQKWK